MQLLALKSSQFPLYSAMGSDYKNNSLSQRGKISSVLFYSYIYSSSECNISSNKTTITTAVLISETIAVGTVTTMYSVLYTAPHRVTRIVIGTLQL